MEETRWLEENVGGGRVFPMDDTGVDLCTDKNELAQGKSVRVMERDIRG